MNPSWLSRLYGASLRLYPSNFQAEFGEEMQAVFNQALDEACQDSFSLSQLCLSELTGLPVALLRAYFGLPVRPNRQLHVQTGSWRELALALAVFLLPAGLILFNGASTEAAGLPLALLFLGVMLVSGWLAGMPLWSAPYLGLVLVISGYLHLFQWVSGLLAPTLIAGVARGPIDYSTYLILQAASTGFVWLALFCLTLLAVALVSLFNRFQPLLVRLHSDWTLLSYILYGEAIFTLAALFQSQHTNPNYAIASLICLAGGIGLYLRSPQRWQRVLALTGCLTLAITFVALDGQLLALDSLSSVTSVRLVVSWAVMVIALLLPGFLARLPSTPQPRPS